jgi:hypothetical protein
MRSLLSGNSAQFNQGFVGGRVLLDRFQRILESLQELDVLLLPIRTHGLPFLIAAQH